MSRVQKRRQVGRKRRDADRRNPGGERDAARGGNRDADAGIASGSDGDRDPVEDRKPPLHGGDDPVEHRQERFGVAALHQDAFAHDGLARARVEDAGRAGAEGGVDGENAHLQGLRVVRSCFVNSAS